MLWSFHLSSDLLWRANKVLHVKISSITTETLINVSSSPLHFSFLQNNSHLHVKVKCYCDFPQILWVHNMYSNLSGISFLDNAAHTNTDTHDYTHTPHYKALTKELLKRILFLLGEKKAVFLKSLSPLNILAPVRLN